MRREEHRHVTMPRHEPLPKEPPKPCMRGIIDLKLYNQTGEVKYIEPLTEFVPPVETEEQALNPVMSTLKREERLWLTNLNPNKPSKDQLEQDLRAGMSIAEIGKKYDASKSSANNWIRTYGLQGIKGQSKDTIRDPDTDADHDMVQNHPKDDMIQPYPTLVEIEQFHTDNPPQELPRVELNEPLTIVLETEESKPEESPTFDEVWKDVQSDLVALQHLYVAEAKKPLGSACRGCLPRYLRDKAIGQSGWHFKGVVVM